MYEADPSSFPGVMGFFVFDVKSFPECADILERTLRVSDMLYVLN